MTGDRSQFYAYNNFDGGFVTFGDGSMAKIIGKGTITGPGLPEIKNVLYVDGLKYNLLSISQICDEEHSVSFSKDMCKILNSTGKLVMKGLRTGDNCYVIENHTNPSSSTMCHVAVQDETELWHHRLGHVHYRNLFKLSQKNLVRGLPKMGKRPNAVCIACQKGKQIKVAHKRTSILVTSKPFELLHMDLVGPTRVLSQGGKRYFFVVVDDYSKFTWVAFLREKSDTFGEFQKLVKQLHNEKGYMVARIRSDHGGEFEDHHLKDLCDELGIHHEFSAP